MYVCLWPCAQPRLKSASGCYRLHDKNTNLRIGTSGQRLPDARVNHFCTRPIRLRLFFSLQMQEWKHRQHGVMHTGVQVCKRIGNYVYMRTSSQYTCNFKKTWPSGTTYVYYIYLYSTCLYWNSLTHISTYSSVFNGSINVFNKSAAEFNLYYVLLFDHRVADTQITYFHMMLDWSRRSTRWHLRPFVSNWWTGRLQKCGIEADPRCPIFCTSIPLERHSAHNSSGWTLQSFRIQTNVFVL